MSAGRDLLKRLAFRDDLGQSYLVRTANRDRLALVVPMVLETRRLLRLAAYDADVISQLADEGLIGLAAAAVDVTFVAGVRGDEQLGRPVRITHAGRHALAPAWAVATR